MKDHILSKNYSELEEYINKLEEYALIGMMGNVLSHGYNSGIMTLNHLVDNLPEEHSFLKQVYSKTFGLVNSLTKMSYLSEYRSTVYFKDLKKWLEEKSIALKVKSEFEFFGHKNIFYAILFELLQNAISNTELVNRESIEVQTLTNKLIISNIGVPPKNPDNIFNLGYTEKRGGKGFGLYASKKSLNKMGYDLRYIYNKSSSKNKFIIEKLK